MSALYTLTHISTADDGVDDVLGQCTALFIRPHIIVIIGTPFADFTVLQFLISCLFFFGLVVGIGGLLHINQFFCNTI